MNKNSVIYAIVGIIVAIGLFFGGVKYGEAHGVPGTAAAGIQSGQFGQVARGQGGAGGQRTNQSGVSRQVGVNGGFTSGEVLSKDDKSITVKLQAGGSKIVFTTASTTVLKSTQGALSDVGIGATVMVQGSTNTDGSVTAQSIQLRQAPQQNQRIN